MSNNIFDTNYPNTILERNSGCQLSQRTRKKERNLCLCHTKAAGFPPWCKHICLTLKSECSKVWQSYLQSWKIPNFQHGNHLEFSFYLKILLFTPSTLLWIAQVKSSAEQPHFSLTLERLFWLQHTSVILINISGSHGCKTGHFVRHHWGQSSKAWRVGRQESPTEAGGTSGDKH